MLMGGFFFTQVSMGIPSYLEPGIVGCYSSVVTTRRLNIVALIFLFA
jgi:hypothetical protein